MADGAELPELHEVLQATWCVSAEWNSLGLSLGIDKDRLKIIQKDAGGCEMCLKETLTHWVSNDDSPTWQKIANALCSETVNRRDCAELIGNNHIFFM